MIIITSKQAGFRRAGLPHPTEPTQYPDGVFNEEQIARLQSEPMLVVQVVEDAAQADTEDVPATSAATAAEAATETEAETGDDVLSRITAVFPSLSESDMKADGTPLVKAVEAALGEDVTAAQVAEAWTVYQQAGSTEEA